MRPPPARPRPTVDEAFVTVAAPEPLPVVDDGFYEWRCFQTVDGHRRKPFLVAVERMFGPWPSTHCVRRFRTQAARDRWAREFLGSKRPIRERPGWSPM